MSETGPRRGWGYLLLHLLGKHYCQCLLSHPLQLVLLYSSQPTYKRCFGVQLAIELEPVSFKDMNLDYNQYTLPYIPLVSRVLGPYGKLWTELFPFFYDPSAKRADHENKEGKKEDP